VDKAPDAFRTISEVADDLDVPQHVLRFWESRFPQIKPMKRAGGRRYYRPDDVDLLRGIHHLLYGEGYTIRGVQRILKDEGPKHVQTVWREGAAPLAATTERHGERRGLLGMLPSLLGRESGEPGTASDADDSELLDVNVVATRTLHIESGHRAVPRDDLRKLKETLIELGECRRLLDTALDS
jgi:DNA-binding transcriptional MerR regulator